MGTRHHLAVSLAVTATLLGVAWWAAPDEPNGGTTMDVPNHRFSASGYNVAPLAPEAIQELVSKLTPEQANVTQRADTELAFCGNLHDNHEEGLYACVVCGLPLFSSDHKFDSGTGWPSFFTPFDKDHLSYHEEPGLGYVSTEIRCVRCDAHLGHVFSDGPRPTGLRYCLNSAALTFVEAGRELPPESRPSKLEVAYFAAGCFWGVEHAFGLLPGVVETVSGYQNGRTRNPTYAQVSNEDTGHAEAVKVVFDPSRVSYEQLVRFFFVIHDPTSLNAQGPDVGTQYRSAIFVRDKEQRATAERVTRELAERGTYGDRRIVTAVECAGPFWPAEEFHQDFVARTGAACHVNMAAAREAAGVAQ